MVIKELSPNIIAKECNPFNISKVVLIPVKGSPATEEEVTAAVNAWLEAHPEATTTVQNGSITFIKLASDVKAIFIKTPEDSSGNIDFGEEGQVLHTNGDGTTYWGEGGQTEAQVNALIAAYMQANYDNGDTRSY